MKKLLSILCLLVVLGTSAMASISAFSSFDGSSTGLFVPLGDSGMYLGFGGKVSNSTGSFQLDGWIGVDGLPILGGMELDLNLAGNSLSSLALGKSFTYKLTEQLTVGFAIYAFDYALDGSNSITILPYFFPFISADLNF
jgi:hypothetical protein